ncbi:hypothetical protein BCJMU51_p71 (plasmid) [Bacillus cereus]|uniref:hypothetical protein n=1 Tax=Bacillus cereus TaxID=1396 RepID=UPI001F384506|nr:hypothetical protein [Bacillus cereus]BCC27264.1 hypothetical protein BCM0079_p306 [Bacillus cereus]BCC27272.1 hypothetical protein BCM0079_p314 [Bacillus cereus]BCC38827.1 hypothetical protein BCM0105_p51 [Bacillus cereus]BCC44691.1 hypothetical protein BCJMU01_p58 [Bacillus cereus]BCC68307.1 hypothetical protein BCJMU39_p34 [Bacillus cereus]
MPKVVSSKEKMQPKTFKLHPRTIEQIKELAEKKQMTQAEVIDKALKLLAR